MSDKSSSGIGIGSIIIFMVIFNILFCNDDIKEIVVETQEEATGESKKKIKDNLQDVVTSAKKAFSGVKDKITEELNVKKEGEKIDKTQDKQTSEKETIERRNKKKEMETHTEPMEKGNAKKERGFKKL